MKTLLLASSIVILAGATGLAWQATRGEQDAVRSMDRIATEAIRAQKAAKRAELRLVETGKVAGELRGQLSALQHAPKPGPASVGAATSAAVAVPTAGDLSTPEAVAAKLAEVREKTKQAKSEVADFASQRAWIVTTYQPLFTALGWSPEQCERFIEIGMKRYERMTDLGALKKERLIADTDPVVEKFQDLVWAEEDAAYRELFGPADHQRFMEYNRTATARNIITAHAAAAVLAGVPFTPTQLEQFVQITAASYTQPHNDRHVYFWWQYDPIDWDKADAQLRPLMSAAQWEVFLTYAPDNGPSRAASKFQKIFETAAAANRAALGAPNAKLRGS